MESKIKKLLAVHTPGTALLPAWLEAQGISHNLQNRYRRNGWLEPVAKGAFKRPGDDLTWQGGLYALQVQAKHPVHAGAMTALALQGLAHYARLGQSKVFLFSPPKTPLSAWFRNHDWQVSIRHFQTSVLPQSLGLTDRDERTFSIRVSSPERAMLECLYLAPDELDLAECFQVMEGLTNLRPKLVQQLLQACKSVKTKRLFLYLAERANHQWLSFVETSKLDLGKGDRSLAKGGVYVAKYHLVVPASMAAL